MGQSREALGLSDLGASVLRHKRKAIAVFVAITTAFALLIAFFPRAYYSEARLMVRVGRATVALDPTVTTGEVVAIQDTRESEITSVLDVLQSRMLQEQVVQILGPELLLDEEPVSPGQAVAGVQPVANGPALAVTEARPAAAPRSGEPAGHPQPLSQQQANRPRTTEADGESVLVRLGLKDPVTNFERAVQELDKHLKVYRGKNSTVISVGYEASSPQLAQQVVQAFVDCYLREHVRVNRTHGSYRFFQEQRDQLQAKLDTAARELRDFKNQVGVASFETRRADLQKQVADVETAHYVAQAEAAAVSAARGAVVESLETTPERIDTELVRGMPHMAADNMREKLYELEIKELELLARYTELHPFVKEIREQVAEAKRIMASQDTERVESTTTVNQNHQELQRQFSSHYSQGVALDARLAALSDQKRRLLEDLRRINEAEIRASELQRQVDLAEQSFKSYSVDAEQARIDEQLEVDRISNISVVQNASFVEKPAKPNKAMFAGLGLIVAVLGSASVAWISERMNRSLRTPQEVEEELDLPVWTSIS